MFVFLFIFIVFVFFLLAMRGRRKHPKLAQLCSWSYAHRGFHGNGVPENSVEAFRNAKDRGYGVELDVHLLADGKLAVIHDHSLKRTTGRDVQIEDLTRESLVDCYLEGTDQVVPLLEEVLELLDGQVPLIIELKSRGDNYAELCRQTCDLLEKYSVLYCIESFDPRCIIWLKKNRPNIVRGQLAENYFRTKDCKLPWIIKLVMANHLMNFLSKPDFIAYNYTDRKRFVNWICRKLWGLAGFSWTVDTENVYRAVTNEGWISIFEGFEL